MNFVSPVAGLGLLEINLYPYLTWIFYALFFLFIPLWFNKEWNLFALFLVSLAFESALIIDVGFFVRPSYIIGLILILKISIKGFRFPARYSIPVILFTIVALTGVFLNLDLIGKADPSFTRGTFLRPIIQLGQLITLILIMVSVYVLLQRGRYFRRAVRVLHWVSVIVALYAIWEIVAIYFNLPFLNLDVMRPSYWYIGFGTNLGYIFRPHATFIEPIELNNFQFLGIASSLAYRILYKISWRRFWPLLVIQLVVLLGSFSRSTMVTFILIAPIFFLFYPRYLKGALGFLFDRTMYIALVAAAVLIFVGGFTLTLEDIQHTNPFKQLLYSRIIQARENPILGFSRFGRADALAEILPLIQENRWGFGVGIGNDANFRGQAGGTASLYNQIIIQTGFIGLVIFLVFLSSVLYALFRNYWRRANNLVFRKVCWIFFIGFLGILIQRLSFSGLFTDTYLWVAFALCIYLGQSKSAILIERNSSQ